MLAIAAARGARCNQTLTFFRKAGARPTPPRPRPCSLSSATIQEVARLLLSHKSNSILHQSILSISHLLSTHPSRLKPARYSICLYLSTLHTLLALSTWLASLLSGYSILDQGW